MSGLEPGFQLGHYRIVRSLGSGGMADVYEAHDENLERTVALKVLPIEYCRNPQLVQRFQKEVRAAAKLNHRNIVTVYEVGQQENYHFFSMRLLTGGDLRRRIEQGLTPVESLAILRELADAFAHAHARGFVHRDVKPENVMFDEQGFPVLTDFGIAKALDANTHMTRTGMTMGTPRYLSPEQASGKPVDARADLYSLGVMFFEMLTGRPPYDAEESMAVIFKHVTEPIPVLPPDFARYQPLLEKLMAKDANQRIASAADLIKEIDAIVPRQPTAELKQSQVRTAENPLIAALMTPSPLRTPAPKTPRPTTPPPKTPAPSMPPAAPVIREMTGEVAVRPPPVAARGAPARPAPAPAPAVRAQAAPPAPPADEAVPVASARASRMPIVAGAVVAALAVAVGAFVALRSPAPAPATTAAPAAAEPDAAAKAEAARRDAEQRAAAERYARQQAEAEARKRAEQQAAQKAAADVQAKRQADEEARRQAEAQAEAQRRAEAQAEAQRRAQAEAEAKQRAQAQAEAEARKRAQAQAEAEARKREQAEAEARRQAEAEAAARQKAAEEPSLTAEEIERRAREADRIKAAQRNQKAPEKKAAPPPEPAKDGKTAEEEESEALERARRPTGF